MFSVETIADRCSDDDDYKETISVKTKEGLELILKSKNYYDEQNITCRRKRLLTGRRVNEAGTRYTCGIVS